MTKFKAFLPQASNELRKRLNKLIQWPETLSALDVPHFSEDFFHVSQCSHYLALPDFKKKIFLSENSKFILNEAIAIEQAGIAYAQRMGAFSESQEERYFYAQVVQEEMEHLRMLHPFASHTSYGISSFVQLIGEIIENEKTHNSILLIQILLEGWGLHYYSDLAKHTNSLELRAIFTQILKDESRHHGGGLVLFLDKMKNQEFLNLNISKLRQILSAIQIGPFQVALSLAHVCELESLGRVQDMLIELKAEEKTQEKLALVEKILMKALDWEIMNGLSDCFRALGYQQMASVVWAELSTLKDLDQQKEIVI